jgi:ketosteroid isomerase-like protein
MNEGQLLDRLAIRELIESYAAGAMSVDVDRWGEVWVEDSAWQLSSMDEPVIGKDNILKCFKETIEYVGHLSLMAFPVDTVIEGETAHGKVYCQETVYPKKGGKIEVVGWFTDEYVKQDGRWYFRSRIYKRFGMKVYED